MKITPLLLAAVLISAPAAAADHRTACPGCRAEHEALVAVGVGAERTCREFSTTYRHNKADAELYFAWADGFWSLASLSRAQLSKTTKDLTTEPQARDQLVNYCHIHPGDAFFRAAMEVYDGFLDAKP
jgi:hypothetical protein